MSRIASLLVATTLVAACTPSEPASTELVETAPAATDGSGEGSAAAAQDETVDADEAMSSPALLSVSSDREGVLYVDSRRRDETLPARGMEVAAGWHYAQVLYDGGRLLSAPRPASLEAGQRIAVRVRTPFDDATHDAAGEGAGAAPFPPELDVVAFEFPPPPVEGSGEGSGAAADEGSGELAEGSGTSAPPLPFPEGRAALVVMSDPPGELFVEGRATGLRTPTNIHLPPGTYRFQIVHDDAQTLSRSLSAGLATHVIRRVNFVGTADFILR